MDEVRIHPEVRAGDPFVAASAPHVCNSGWVTLSVAAIDEETGEEYLVHLQNRFQVMSYSSDHETSHLCPYTFEKGAQGSAGRAALQRRLRPASLPDTPGERPWRDRAADSRKSWVRFADGARRYPRLQPARGGCPGCGLLTPKANSHRFRQRANRSSQRALTPLSQGVR